jgi:LmbE family N-acetylglucosaminyl deacetylase
MTTVLALGCHPDDIEFMMSGVLFLLKERGCSIHYALTANGGCGSLRYGTKDLIRIRRDEAKAACELMGAHFHDSIANDLEVFYVDPLIRKVAALVREVRPDIMFLMSPQDYMEDHMNSCRLGVTAAFAKGVPNYRSDPPREAYQGDVTLYHALPYGLNDGLAKPVAADFYVDVGSVIDKKQEMLAKHVSQQEWLDKSQGLNSYLATMRSMCAEVGARSGRFTFAEGFRYHSHLGFSSQKIDPLKDILAGLWAGAK